jgi:hypothetical protein
VKGNDEFCLTKYLFYTSKDFLTCCKILWNRVEGFTSPPKECMLQIFIASKSTALLTGFEPRNLGSNGKHSNH